MYVRGSGFADASDADTTAPGQWAGGTTADGEVSVGNSVVVGVAPDYVLRVVYVPADGATAATLHEATGPEA